MMTDPTRHKQVNIGLIATGDELTQGDIVNTNGQAMAQTLHEMGFALHQHVIVDDLEQNITDAIHYQATRCDIIILSGGLGPTSDDRTRYALAKALQCELQFDETCWHNLSQRLTKLNRDIHDCNRQQALFPAGADILPNAHGTAAGCYIQHQQIHYFMLPGPPSECLPMFHQHVVPKLIPFSQPTHKFKWLLLGANEGEVAAKLDAALIDLHCQTGYRWAYPYLEFKVSAASNALLTQAEQRVANILEPYLISTDNDTAEQQLNVLLTKNNLHLHFADNHFSQWIKMQLINAKNYTFFTDATKNTLHIDIFGLNEYWQHATPPLLSHVTITLSQNDKYQQKELNIYYRDDNVKHYLVAIVCREILHFVADN